MDAKRWMAAGLMAAGLSALALAAGCSDSAACSSNDDCFGGEVCRGGSCLVVAETDAGNNGGPNNSTSDAGANNSTSDADHAGDTGDSGGANNGTPDADGLECAATGFEGTCDNDQYETNEDWIDSYHLDANTPFGCFSDFRTLDQTLDATLCPLEAADYFDFSYNSCRDSGYYIDLEFRPTQQCSDALVHFEVKNHPCDDPDVSCQSLANGGKKIRIIVAQTPNQSTNNPLYFFVAPASGEQRVLLDYQLQVSVHR